MNEGEFRSPEEIIDDLTLRYLKYENKDLRSLREESRKTESPEKVKQLRDRYQNIAQEMTNEPEDQLGIMFASALMIKNSGDHDGFMAELEDIRVFAFGFGWVEIGSEVSKLIEMLR